MENEPSEEDPLYWGVLTIETNTQNIEYGENYHPDESDVDVPCL